MSESHKMVSGEKLPPHWKAEGIDGSCDSCGWKERVPFTDDIELIMARLQNAHHSFCATCEHAKPFVGEILFREGMGANKDSITLISTVGQRGLVKARAIMEDLLQKNGKRISYVADDENSGTYTVHYGEGEGDNFKVLYKATEDRIQMDPIFLRATQ